MFCIIFLSSMCIHRFAYIPISDLKSNANFAQKLQPIDGNIWTIENL